MRIFVSTGTDHFPFDRLIGWIERWAGAHPDDEVVVQHGSTRPPAVTKAVQMLTISEMRDEIDAADVVVVAGGPGAVMTARERGRRPIAVARHRGEAVDDHQRAFVALMQRRGIAFGAGSEIELEDLLAQARTSPRDFRCDPPPNSRQDTVLAFTSLVDRVVRGA
jgi:UDP-N-acetylglucosamine transferase subunit ALG13